MTFCKLRGGEEVAGDVDGGEGYDAGDGNDEAFVAADLDDVAFLALEHAVEDSHFVSYYQF